MNPLQDLKSIDVQSLILDTNNPRLPKHEYKDQSRLIKFMARIQGDNLVGMAEHLFKYGPSPVDIPIVMKDDNKDFIVLDGNRRLTAIKALENPNLIEGSVKSSVLNKIKKISKNYPNNPISEILCYIVKNRAEADPWIQLRHRGLQGGSGLNEWDGYVAARYDAITGDKSVGLQVIDYVTDHSKLSKETLERIRSGKFPITTLERIVRTPYVRNQLGYDVKKNKVYTDLPINEVVKGLARIVEDVGSGDITVTDVKTLDKRIKYVDNFPSEDCPNLSKSKGKSVLLEDSTTKSRKKRKKKAPKPRLRLSLIPKSLELTVEHHRIEAIADELKKLNINKFPNAGAVLFRVFFELSVDYYLENNIGWDQQKVNNSTLRQKLHGVINYFESNKIMTKSELGPIKKAAGGQTLLASSVRTMHKYVHSKYFSPKSTELKAAWNDLEAFMQNIW